MHDLGRALGDSGISEIGPERRVQRLTRSAESGHGPTCRWFDPGRE
jgi:hypothetical protein